MLKSTKRRFIGQLTQKVARISKAARLVISMFSTPISYSKSNFGGEEKINEWGKRVRELEQSCWLLLSCCHTPVPSILTYQ